MSMPWYGELPKRWEEVRNKWLFTEAYERNEKTEAPLLSFSRSKGLIPFQDKGNRTLQSDDLTKYRIVRRGQLLINRMQAWSGMFIYVDKYGCVSPDYSVFNANKNVCVKYYEYLFRTPLMVEKFANASKGVGDGFNRLYTPQFYEIRVIHPPRDEQEQIVRYLDWKVSGINRLINAKRRQIGLLQEQKHITIKSAFRNTENCKKCKLKNLAFFKSGTNLTSLEIEPAGNYPVYGGNGLRGYYSNFSHSGQYLLIGRQGALCGNVHYVNEKFWATEHAITVKPNDIAHIKWLYYLLIDMNLNQYSMAAAQPGISVEYIINIPTYFPPYNEQQSIANHLDNKCANIDKVINKLNEEITLFTEYRTRLISDVVTGKLDVCGVVVPEFEAVEDVVGDEEVEEEESTKEYEID